jgi:hypothetical protein
VYSTFDFSAILCDSNSSASIEKLETVRFPVKHIDGHCAAVLYALRCRSNNGKLIRVNGTTKLRKRAAPIRSSESIIFDSCYTDTQCRAMVQSLNIFASKGSQLVSGLVCNHAKYRNVKPMQINEAHLPNHSRSVIANTQ